MKYTTAALAFGDRTAHLFVPTTAEPLTALYLNTSRPDDIAALAPKLFPVMGKALTPALLVCVTPTDWDADFSPWPAAPLYPDAPPFSGQADQRIDFLLRTLKPALDAQYNTLPDAAHTGVFGYSLGGLAALYAACEHPETFGLCGCLSGSLWFDGFMDYLRGRVPALHDQRVCLSLGRKEEKTRHPQLSTIGTCYEEAAALLSAQLGAQNVSFTLHNGGHGTEVPQRMLHALHWLLAPRA